MKVMKKTVTSIFMVPTLKIPKESLFSNGFLNGYIIDSGREEQYPDCIYVLFHPDNVDRFREFLENEYERTRAVVEDYDYEDGFVVVVYKLNEKFKKDFDLVRQGKYSKTCKEFQNQFPKTIKVNKGNGNKEEKSLQVRVFKKSPELVEYWEDKLGTRFKGDYEAWYAFEEEKETLRLEKVKEEFKELVNESN